MAGWHHWLNGHEFEWTPGVGDGQGGLVCCNSWGRKELDTNERLNWTELNWKCLYFGFNLEINFSGYTILSWQLIFSQHTHKLLLFSLIWRLVFYILPANYQLLFLIWHIPFFTIFFWNFIYHMPDSLNVFFLPLFHVFFLSIFMLRFSCVC